MKDQLSALMDGEFDAQSASHIITSAKSDGEIREAWMHYHLIGDAMRGDLSTHHGLGRRVLKALDAEITVLAPNGGPSVEMPDKAPTKQSAYKSTKFWSIAASVAAVLFVGTIVMQQQFSASDEIAPIEIAQSLPMEYLEAHQAAAPSGAAYYIQNASYNEPK
jgi:sigma-E factor negative regulatory protein RseA